MLVQSVFLNTDSEYGRIKIYTDAEDITKDNVLEIFNTAYSLHQYNAIKEDALFSYERGKQAILDRTKKSRPDINEKVVKRCCPSMIKNLFPSSLFLWTTT